MRASLREDEEILTEAEAAARLRTPCLGACSACPGPVWCRRSPEGGCMRRREVVLGLITGGLMARSAKGVGSSVVTGTLADWKASPASKGFEPAFEYLSSLEASTVATGRTEVVGDDVYALVSRYTTKAPEIARFEVHRKYIDIQCVLAGEEIIGFLPTSAGLSVLEPYDEGKDIAFFARPAAYTPVAMSTGRYAILYPEQAHMPNLDAGGPHDIVKVVVKVSAAWHAARVR